jgi:DNA-binding CsgD family transcriptional regulator
MAYNFKGLIMPHLNELSLHVHDTKGKEYLDVIRANLEKIVSSFSFKFSSKEMNLTSRELQVADLIRQGKTSKEIGALLSITAGTVETYRDRIRKKLGIKNKGINLRSFLTRSFS